MNRHPDVAKRAAIAIGFLGAIIAAFGAGYIAHRDTTRPAIDQTGRAQIPNAPPGSWSAVPVTPDELNEELGALGYLSGYEQPGHRGDVTVHLEGEAYAGLNFYTSGHAPRAVLLDMKGEPLHAWEKAFAEVWPAAGARARFVSDAGRHSWRRAHPYPNGDLVAIFEGEGIVKLDRDSEVLWAHRGGYHHDLQPVGDGKLYVLDRELVVIPRWNPNEPMVEDFIAVLDDATGERLERVSILEAFERSRYAPALDAMARRGDVFHTNTLQVLDPTLREKSSSFQQADVLISIRELSTVAAIDLETQTVTWALSGLWRKQHQPELLPTGHLLVFDNQGRGGKSRVLEIVPETQAVAWSYAGTDGYSLESELLGSCHRLPNGNTLVTESTRGHAIEVAPNGRIVWEFWSTHRAGTEQELVANLYEMLRLPPSYGDAWLD